MKTHLLKSSATKSSKTGFFHYLLICMLIAQTGMSTLRFNGNSLTTYNVNLSSFTSEATEESVKLNWVTLSENCNRCFLIERSTNAVDFTCIDTVNGNGTTTNRSEYSYLDKNPELGLSYYRITQLDLNGNFKKFNIISVEFNPKPGKCDFSKVNIYPIPFNETMSVDLICSKETNLTFQINTASGNKIFENKMNCYAGTNNYQFNELNYIQEGMYFIIISDEKGCKIKFNSIKKITE
ncbi:MAG: hypothetical protein Q8M29_03560 [Bacteroidota bacterium]|nr:hypothetical protein [Bacteroidota bacterium]